MTIIETKVQPRAECVELGPFRLPGVKIDIAQYTASELEEMQISGKDLGGQQLNDSIWSFRQAKIRDWFILKWG